MSLDVYLQVPGMIVIHSQNITHNLGSMAAAAGIYEYLWRPDECKIEKAEGLIGPLKKGLALMKADPEKFKKYNPSNGWGDYVGFVQWIEDYIKACEANPEAFVNTSR